MLLLRMHTTFCFVRVSGGATTSRETSSREHRFATRTYVHVALALVVTEIRSLFVVRHLLIDYIFSIVDVRCRRSVNRRHS
jgi:hypothetical protein